MSVSESRATPAETPDEVPAAGDAADRGTGGGARSAVGRRPADRKASVFVAAAVTAVWAAAVSFVPVLALVVLGWLVAGQQGGTVLGAVRFAAAAWLLAHAVPVGTATGPIGIAPLALTVLVLWRLVRAGQHTARAVGGDRRGALAGALGVATGYGVLAAGVALLLSAPGLTVSPLRALWGAGLLALVAATAGAVHESGMAGHVAGQLPPTVRAGLRGGLCAALGLLALGALAAGAALAASADDAANVFRSYDAGPAGDVGLFLLCLGYAPNLAVWAVGYLAGPGFTFGTDTSVSIADVHLGPVPAVPLLAGMPSHELPAAGTLLLALPLVVGGCVGALLPRWHAGGLPAIAAAGGLAGACCGALLAAAGQLSGGSLGGDRLATVGPSAWQFGLATAVLVAVGALVVAAAARVLAGRRS